MNIEILAPAEASIEEIWLFTQAQWGEDQADRYVRDLGQAISNLPRQRHLWRSVDDDVIKDVFFIRFMSHYIFFREFSNHDIAVINVLHESMDIPSRLKEDGIKII